MPSTLRPRVLRDRDCFQDGNTKVTYLRLQARARLSPADVTISARWDAHIPSTGVRVFPLLSEPCWGKRVTKPESCCGVVWSSVDKRCCCCCCWGWVVPSSWKAERHRGTDPHWKSFLPARGVADLAVSDRTVHVDAQSSSPSIWYEVIWNERWRRPWRRCVILLSALWQAAVLQVPWKKVFFLGRFGDNHALDCLLGTVTSHQIGRCGYPQILLRKTNKQKTCTWTTTLPSTFPHKKTFEVLSSK